MKKYYLKFSLILAVYIWGCIASYNLHKEMTIAKNTRQYSADAVPKYSVSDNALNLFTSSLSWVSWSILRLDKYMEDNQFKPY